MKKTAQRRETDVNDNIMNQFSARKTEFHTDVTMTYTAFWDMTHFNWLYIHICGPGGYGLDGPGSNPGGDEIFCPSRPTLEPTQPPVKWVPGLSRGKVRPGHHADHSYPSSAAVMED